MEKIAVSIPVNKTSAIVTNAKGVHWNVNISFTAKDSKTPIETHIWKGRPYRDLSGQKFGDLTVIGFHRKEAGRGGRSIWTVRCKCGIYTTRKAKALRNPKNLHKCCTRCARQEIIKSKGLSKIKSLAFSL